MATTAAGRVSPASAAVPAAAVSPSASVVAPSCGSRLGPEIFSLSVGDANVSQAATSAGPPTRPAVASTAAGRVSPASAAVPAAAVSASASVLAPSRGSRPGPEIFSLSAGDEELSQALSGNDAANTNTGGLNEDEMREYDEIEESFQRFKARQSEVERNVAELLERLHTRIHVPSSVASSECGDLTSLASSEWDTESLGPTEDGLSVFGSRVGSRAGTPPRSPLGSPRELKPLQRAAASSSSGLTWPLQASDWRTPQKASSSDHGLTLAEPSRPMSSSFTGVVGSERFGTNPLGGERGDLSERSGGAGSVASSMTKAHFSPGPRLTSQLLAAQSAASSKERLGHEAADSGGPAAQQGQTQAAHAAASSATPAVAPLTNSAVPTTSPPTGAEPAPRLPAANFGAGAASEEEELRRWQGWTVVATPEGRLFFHNEPRQLSQWHQPAELRDVLGEWTEITDPQPDVGGEPRGSYWRNELLRISLWKDPRTTTNLFQAALDGNIFFMQLYAEVEGQLDVVDPKGRSALHYACAGGATQSVLLLLQRKAEVDRRDEMGATPLIFACRYGYASVVKVLLDAQADLNSAGEGGSTALHEAASMGQLDCLHLLLLCGADATAVNNDSEVPVDVAAKKRHYSCVTLLRRHLQSPLRPEATRPASTASAPTNDCSGSRQPGPAASGVPTAKAHTGSLGVGSGALAGAPVESHSLPRVANPMVSEAAVPPAGGVSADGERPHRGRWRDGERSHAEYAAGGGSSDSELDAAAEACRPDEGDDAPSSSESSDGAGPQRSSGSRAGARSSRSGRGRLRERSPVALGLLSRMQWVSRWFGGTRRTRADLGQPNSYRYNEKRQQWELAED